MFFFFSKSQNFTLPLSFIPTVCFSFQKKKFNIEEACKQPEDSSVKKMGLNGKCK